MVRGKAVGPNKENVALLKIQRIHAYKLHRRPQEPKQPVS